MRETPDYNTEEDRLNKSSESNSEDSLQSTQEEATTSKPFEGFIDGRAIQNTPEDQAYAREVEKVREDLHKSLFWIAKQSGVEYPTDFSAKWTQEILKAIDEEKLEQTRKEIGLK